MYRFAKAGPRSAEPANFHPKVRVSPVAAGEPEIFGVPVPGPPALCALVHDAVAARPGRLAAELERTGTELRPPLEDRAGDHAYREAGSLRVGRHLDRPRRPAQRDLFVAVG